MHKTSEDWTQENYIKAYRFAAEAHNGQLFPGTDLPYIMHVTFVAMEIIACLDLEKGHDGDLAVQCALLHDVIEDTEEITYADLIKAFGEKVALGVMALTKYKSIAKENRMRDSLQRIKHQPHEIWMVKMADRITNLAPPPHYWNLSKIDSYREEALEIHHTLHEASDYLGKRLLNKIDEYNVSLSVFFEEEGMAFEYDAQARKIFRLEGDKKVDISDSEIAWDMTFRGADISRERAMELADKFEA